jgi:hypothetical protein
MTNPPISPQEKLERFVQVNFPNEASVPAFLVLPGMN